MNYDKVQTVTEPGVATLDVYSYLTGEKELTFLCGPCSRKRRRAELALRADEMYREDSQCADCSPVKDVFPGELLL